MEFSNSKLVEYTLLSPNNSGLRKQAIDRITPHCVVGQCTAEGLGEWFYAESTHTSSNYGIDKTGRVGLYVEEKNRSWCSSSSANDQRAITIECASDKTEPYAMYNVVYERLIDLCVDICKRYGKKKLLWFGDKEKTLAYQPKSDEMVITVHRWFANKSCPGDWLYERLGELAERVTKLLCGEENREEGKAEPESEVEKWYRVRKSWADAKSQKGAYKVLKNAWACAEKNEGYSVFDWNGVAVYEPWKEETEAVEKKVNYRVRVSIKDLNIRKGPGTNYGKTGKFTGIGVFTIVAEAEGEGASKWGKLKSGAGWISLDYGKRI